MAHRPPPAGRLIAALLAALWLGWSAPPAHAIQPSEVLADPALEARAREIGRELRCLVCQNQSIDDSDADLARDLRVLVRQRLTAGDSDPQVTEYVVSRYGDFVLLRPPVKPQTWALWFGPAVIGGLGVLALILYFRRRARAGTAESPAPLSEAEEQRIARLLRDGRG
ncbi:MAG TPA: cytochrome c-type biogenesis protein [Rhodospirillales bacterium]|nr:cytochrome c-type biogenesis protein [Rhodospirillales bacterium]